MSAEVEIKQFIDRILRLEEEQDTLGEDIREVYAEAKGRGYDKTAIGNVVSHQRKVEKLGRDTLHEREAVFDLYLTAYETGGRAPASARTRDNTEEFPVNAKLVATVANAVQTETGRKALIAAVDLMIDREEHIDPDTGEITETAVGGDDVNSTRGARSNDGHQVGTGGESVATNSPETANDMDRTAEGSFETASEVAENAPIPVEPEGGSVSHAGADESSAADERNVEATVERRSSATNFEPPAFLVKDQLSKLIRDYRPHCQKPDACGASGLKHCYSCSKLIVPNEDEAA